MMAVNLDDVSRCPLGVRCESCGVERDDLAVCTRAARGRFPVNPREDRAVRMLWRTVRGRRLSLP